FRETQLFWGTVLFTLLAGLGLSVRFYLERLKLLPVRGAAVLTVVVALLIAALSILSHRPGLEHGLSVALFPMVIMTMTNRTHVDRLGGTRTRRGAAAGLGNLGVATLAYVLMTARAMQHLLFVSPEVLLVSSRGPSIRSRSWTRLPAYPEFVVKPTGSGGDGVLVVAGRSKSLYRLTSGMLMDQPELDHYVSNILSGIFSLGGHPDTALIEYRVQFDPLFATITYQGVPRYRIVVFLGYASWPWSGARRASPAASPTSARGDRRCSRDRHRDDEHMGPGEDRTSAPGRLPKGRGVEGEGPSAFFTPS
ncbi:MAG: 7TM domain-containing protein, partial [Gammaproteobacteria bacterium]